jgi:tetratricopeptide (TPR) repeat protein
VQKAPNDTALRKKIIKHVQAMKRAPAIPEEAERFMARGTAAARTAKDANDFKDAVAEFEKATLAAPWLASAYYNLGISQDQAGMYADAIRNLKLYLLAAPDAPDAKQVRTLVYEIEYRQEKAAKESSPEAIAARKQLEYDEWLRKIDGRRYTNPGDPDLGATGVLDVKGKVLVTGIIVAPGSPLVGPRGYTEHNRHEIRGREAAGPVMNVPDLPGGSWQLVYIISKDGDRITEQHRRGNGTMRENIYLWQR